LKSEDIFCQKSHRDRAESAHFGGLLEAWQKILRVSSWISISDIRIGNQPKSKLNAFCS
jgi:hypothetical protein